ncbi:MAG: glycosyltransferase [bacterium]
MDNMPLDIINSNTLSTPEKLTPPFSWCGHIPFAFWAIKELQPKVVVELGTHTGNSFFAFCQAVKQNTSDTQCYAVDTWQGDEHAGFYENSVYDSVRQHTDEHYQDFATLIRSTFDEALAKIEDGSVDLLHIDGLHTYEAVKHDFETWLPKMSPRGVILFHDTHIHERGFGVWQLWAELTAQYPHFDFSHSCGLGVLGTGEDLPANASKLFSLEGDAKNLTQTLFARLGTAIVHDAEMEKVEHDRKDTEAGIAWYQQQVSTRDQDLQWLNEQLAQRDQQCEKLQKELISIRANIGPAVRLLTIANNLKLASVHAIKSRVKGTPLAPPLYWLNTKIQRVLQGLRHLPNSRQNAKALNAFVQGRQSVLMSDTHSQWLSGKTKTQDLPEIDVSIVTHNSSHWMADFLDSLMALDYPVQKLHLYFVDNASSDNTVELLHEFQQTQAQHFGSIDILQQDNLGFGMGHDAAIRQGSSPFALVTNVDLTLNPDALKIVAHRASTDSASTASWELRQKPYEHPKYVDPVTLEVNWSSHACVLLRREAYEVVRGYEPRIFMYGEDVELSYRLRSHGYRLRYVPDAVVWHYSYNSANEVKPVQFTGSSLANAYLRLRYGNFTDIAAIVPLQLALLLRGGGYPGSRKAVAKNIVTLAKNAGYFLRSRPGNEHAYFPFRAFDYEMIREGAFIELSALEAPLPKVSIVTRTHGEDPSDLKECITSVLNQTYQNIEHIVVEDGGAHKQDLVSEVHRHYHNEDSLKYLPLEKVGRSAAGNQGLKAATGDYLMFLDEDDLLLPDHVETLINTLKQNPDASAAYALAWDTQTIDTPQQIQHQEGSHYREIAHSTPGVFYQEFDRTVLNHHNYIPIQAILFQRQLFDQYGGFDENMTYLEDWDLWKRYAAQHTFKWVKKTTSLFHTPHHDEHRVQRQIELDSAYNHAVEKTKQRAETDIAA